MDKEQYSLLQKAYNGKRVFLTGHTGFKGSWMLTWLNILGANVRGYSLAPEVSHALFNELRGTDLCESVIADVRNQDRLIKEIQEFKPDFIFHLAAQTLVRLS